LVVRNVVRSPLRPIPGPLPAKLSQLWLLAIELSGRRTPYIHSLHQRYGPVVRVAPNELSFATGAARDIYIGVNTSAADAPDKSSPPASYAGAANDSAAPAPAAAKTTLKTFPKADIYDMIPPDISTIRDEAAYRAHLKRVGHCFSVSLLPDMEPVIWAELQQLLGVMEARRGEVVNE
jgi:hypothetical protein